MVPSSWGAWAWQCPGRGCSDGQQPGQQGQAGHPATLEQGPGSPGGSRHPCPRVSNLPPWWVGDPLVLAQPCPSPHGAGTVLTHWDTAPEPATPQQLPSTGLGQGCLLPRERAGGEGTGTLPELLLYK